MPITQYKGKTLLNPETITAIQNDTDLLLKNKDVGAAWSASQHIKAELTSLPKEELGKTLNDYRRITTSLKALALPLLSEDDVSHLLHNNLEFLDTKSGDYLVSGLSAWLASQEDSSVTGIKEKLRSSIDNESPFAPKILSVLGGDAEEKISKRRQFPNNDELLDKSESKDLIQSAHKADVVDDIGEPKLENSNSAESLSQQIFSQSGSTESEQVFVARAKALITSRLRDVRTTVDLAEYLKRPFVAGGLGLNDEVFESATKLIEDEYRNTHTHKPKQISENKPLPQIPQKKSPVLPKKPSIIPKKETAKKQIDNLIKSDAADTSEISNILKGKPVKPVSKPIPQKQVQKRPIVRRAASNGKIRLDDIKTSHVSTPVPDISRSMGLSDEFSTISLEDFRKLGDTNTAVSSLLGKIDVLAEESIAHKIDGIRNFHKSPLMALYIDLGEQSLSQSKKLSDVLADVNINPEKMTEDEFFAVASLTSKLK